MRSSLTFGLLLVNLIVGLFLSSTISTEAYAHFDSDHKSSIQTIQGEISGCFLTSENVSFDGDGNPPAYLLSAEGNTLLGFASITEAFFSQYSSLPLFDIKKLFIHFFHTW